MQTVQAEPAPGQEWAGDSPFFLVIEPDDRSEGNLGIDLDESGWLTTHAAWLRRPGAWVLYLKATGQPIFAVIVEEGDQPYFTRRHIGNLMAGAEISAFGIGKKAADGTMTRLWLLPNGLVCGGDDVEIIASRMLG